MLKVKLMYNENGIYKIYHEWTQVDTNPTSIAAILIALDSLEENESIEIERIK